MNNHKIHSIEILFRCVMGYSFMLWLILAMSALAEYKHLAGNDFSLVQTFGIVMAFIALIACIELNIRKARQEYRRYR